MSDHLHSAQRARALDQLSSARGVIAGAAIDRFGFFGTARIGLTLPRAVGLVLLGVGAALSLKR